MVEVCSPAASEDRGHMSKVDGPESLAISIRDVSYKLMNLKLVMAERYRTVRVMVSEDR